MCLMTQKEALDILKTGRSVFLTGAAGSGKTYVLREYINYLQNLGADIGITASTGIRHSYGGYNHPFLEWHRHKRQFEQKRLARNR